MFSKNRMVFVFWGVLDLVHIAIYSVFSYRSGNIPYFSDFFATIDNVFSHGVPAVGFFVMVSWILEVSIFLSAFLFLFFNKWAAVFYYFQLPFRLIYFVPSVSFLFVVLGGLELLKPVLVIVFVVLSEFIKFYSIRRFRSNQ